MHRPTTLHQPPKVISERVMATLPLIVESLDRIDFFLDFVPPEITSQQKGCRVVVPNDPSKKPFVSFFTKAEVVKAEKAIAGRLLQFRPKQPFTGPLRLVTEWTWPWRASEPKKNRVDGWKWRDTMPDWDNIAKIFCDQMAELQFFLNDSQVADGRAMKMWGDRPGIRVTLEALESQGPNPMQHKPMDAHPPAPKPEPETAIELEEPPF